LVTFDNKLSVEVIIWGGVETDKHTREQSVTFSPGLPKGVKLPEAEMIAFQTEVLEHAAVWVSFESLCDKAEYALTHEVKVQSSGKLVRKVKANVVDNSIDSPFVQPFGSPAVTE
jgi:hypothetical protein